MEQNSSCRREVPDAVPAAERRPILLRAYAEAEPAQKKEWQPRQHQLTRTLPHKIYSEAGLGKAYLREMGIKPWRQVQADFDPKIIGAIMSSYFGGRAEVHRRREIVQALYCDFASMYPTFAP